MQRSSIPPSSVVVAVLLASFAGACLPSFPQPGDDSGGSIESNPTPRIAGTLLDAGGAGLADVSVQQDGRELGITDAQGRFEVYADPGETFVLQFHKAGHVRGLERVTIADGPTALRVTLLDQAPAISG